MIPGTFASHVGRAASSGGGTTQPPTGTQYTVTRNIAASADDGMVMPFGGSYTQGFTNVNGFADNQRNDCYYRFLNLTVPRGAVVNSATVKLWVDTVTNNNNSYGTLHAMAVDNATNPTSQSVALTTANVVLTNLSAGTSPLFDVTACVQEVVSRSGWASGNALCIKGNGAANGAASTVQFGAQDAVQYLPNYMPVLTVTYTA